MHFMILSKPWKLLNLSFKKVRYYSTLTNKKKITKFEKNTKFHEDLYKYHFEQYVDNASTRPDLYIKDLESSEKNNFDNRLKRNIPFVYSNEVKNLEELKKNPFTLVNIKNKNNESFGVATFNPYALITARIFNYNSLFSINIHFFIEKIKNALLWRSKIMDEEEEQEEKVEKKEEKEKEKVEKEKEKEKSKEEEYNFHSKSICTSVFAATPESVVLKEKDLAVFDNYNKKIPNKETIYNSYEHIFKTSSHRKLNSQFCYRLINGEGDNLPGLIVDRYDDFICVQHLTLGCEMLACVINDALIELLKPKAIIFRNDNKERLLERLELYKKVIYGEIKEQILLMETNCYFLIDLLYSPGTGWFYNRKNVRKYLCQFCLNKNVLDLFSYVGSFGIQCSKIGKAQNVVCVEKNEKFVQMAKESAILNKVNNVKFVCDDALHFLDKCKTVYDIIILDPPNLIPKSGMLESGSKKYIDLIHVTQKCVASNGLLLIIFTSKLCSYQDYINIINKAFINTNKIVKIVGQGRGSPDNPVHLSLYTFSDFYWFLLQLSY